MLLSAPGTVGAPAGGAGVVGKTTSEMQSQSVPGTNGIYGAVGAGWDFFISRCRVNA